MGITSSTWTPAPLMNKVRKSLACVADQVTDMLYAIGGVVGGEVDDNTVEIISIRDMTQLDSESWSFVDSTIGSSWTRGKALIYGNDIMLLGGQTSGASQQYA